jgi:hypothetical protein
LTGLTFNAWATLMATTADRLRFLRGPPQTHAVFLTEHNPQTGLTSSHFFFLRLQVKQPVRDLALAPTNSNFLSVSRRAFAAMYCGTETVERG